MEFSMDRVMLWLAAIFSMVGVVIGVLAYTDKVFVEPAPVVCPSPVVVPTEPTLATESSQVVEPTVEPKVSPSPMTKKATPTVQPEEK